MCGQSLFAQGPHGTQRAGSGIAAGVAAAAVAPAAGCASAIAPPHDGGRAAGPGAHSPTQGVEHAQSACMRMPRPRCPAAAIARTDCHAGRAGSVGGWRARPLRRRRPGQHGPRPGRPETRRLELRASNLNSYWMRQLPGGWLVEPANVFRFIQSAKLSLHSSSTVCWVPGMGGMIQ